MTKVAAAKIFLADERGVYETPVLQSRRTFCFEDYVNEHKQAPGNLYVLNDNMLAPDAAATFTGKEDNYIVLLPVAGAITVKETTVAAGQVWIAATKKEGTVTIHNAFANETINYLQLCFKNSTGGGIFYQTFEELRKNKNQLIPITSENQHPFKIALGLFTGRGEATYTVKDPTKKTFVFVITGAFEVEGRLLHESDGLAIWNTSNIEMEALSTDGLILVTAF